MIPLESPVREIRSPSSGSGGLETRPREPDRKRRNGRWTLALARQPPTLQAFHACFPEHLSKWLNMLTLPPRFAPCLVLQEVTPDRARSAGTGMLGLCSASSCRFTSRVVFGRKNCSPRIGRLNMGREIPAADCACSKIDFDHAAVLRRTGLAEDDRRFPLLPGEHKVPVFHVAGD